jgi:hypothetical protein
LTVAHCVNLDLSSPEEGHCVKLGPCHYLIWLIVG